MMLRHRLGWLNNLVAINGWKKPIIILGFDQYIPSIDDYTHLVFSSGTLAQVSNDENIDGFIPHVSDPRFNHLCLSNHDILSNKIIDYIIKKIPIDLNEGFIKNILSEKKINDFEFSNKELCKVYTERYLTPPLKISKFIDRFIKSN
jgi:hypothetical protein